MKSSSQLFPVELVSAEIRNDIYQDIYSLKPNRSEDTSVEIALLHLHTNKDSSHQKQILLIHDVFQSHWQWMDDGDFQGVIDQLLSEGYAIWLMDWRAHGTSKKNRKFQLNTIEHMAKFDLTSVVDFITEKSDQKLVVGAIGYGAKMTLLSLPYLRSIQQLIFLDAVSISPTRKLWIPGYRIIKFLSLMGKEWVNGPGTELESAALFRSGLKFGGVFSFFVRQNIAEVLAMVDANATKISWICSSRRSVKIGKRLAKKQARIHKVSVDGVISEFKKLISSQPI